MEEEVRLGAGNGRAEREVMFFRFRSVFSGNFVSNRFLSTSSSTTTTSLCIISNASLHDDQRSDDDC